MNKIFFSTLCLLIALLSLVSVCAVDVDSCSCEGIFSESNAGHVVLDENYTCPEINSHAVCNVADNPINNEHNDGLTLNSNKTQSYATTNVSSINNNLVKDANDNENTFKELNNIIITKNKLDNNKQNDPLVLEKDYIFNPKTDGDFISGIDLPNNFIIDGKGHTIDANNSARIFNIDGIVTLKNIIFINGWASYGGAIFNNKGSNLTILDCEFINNNAYYGGAICDINSTTYLNHVNLINNGASILGGGIYKIYGKLEISDSNFNNNTAKNGGALYISHCNNNCVMNDILFDKNIAEDDGGAIYLLLSNITDKGNIVFKDNISSRLNGLYSTKYINFYVNSSNYTMVIADISNFNGTLPSRFSLIDNGWVTPVKEQIGNTCWDYAIIGAIESALLKATGVVYDLSENNLKNVMGIFSDSGDIRYVQDDGWYTSDTHEFLASWFTLVSEDLDPAVKGSYFSPNFNNELIHIQNVAFASRKNSTDNDEIKEALMKYGAVLSSMHIESKYFNGINYYYNGGSSCNHGIVIVGWDDSYSKNNFNGDCPGDGAWIVRNAEGPNYKDHGYFYISYYDTKIAYTSQYFIFNDTLRFDRNYQHDYIMDSWKKINGKFAFYKNVYRSVDDEELLAFSSFFDEACDWEVSIYVGDKLEYSQTGKAMSKGYFTFNFDDAVKLSKGDEFSIVLKVSNGKSTNYIPINNKNKMVTTTGDRGISYYSLDGKTWTDLDENNQVACLKVFSRNINVNSNMAVATTTD